MDVITAAAVMSAAFCTSERHTDDETPGPPQKRLRRPPAADVCSSSILAEVGNPRGAYTTGAPGTPSTESIDLCPLCGNATFKKGGLREEVDIVARGQVGGAVASGTGRYKIRKEARKDNRLAAWYSRFGYRGPLYCKACSGTLCIQRAQPLSASSLSEREILDAIVLCGSILG
jgi:hypothetical protein|eukprot:COSAG02_NODE_475_length_21552_cov_4.236470_15_plen_174_part_00